MCFNTAQDVNADMLKERDKATSHRSGNWRSVMKAANKIVQTHFQPAATLYHGVPEGPEGTGLISRDAYCYVTLPISNVLWELG